jgi:peptidoglycan/xylan/chitin deacetylase (PgdA/CDA1 family)
MSLWTRWMARSPRLRRLGRYMLRAHCPVFMYHGVVPTPLNVFNWCHLPVSHFRAQMLYLKAHYRVIPLIEVVERLEQRRPFPESAACITFDDAFRSVLDFAFPILRELELPFTVFVVSQLFDQGATPWPERLFSALVHTGMTSLAWRDQTWNIATPSERSACYQALVEQFMQWTPNQRDAGLDELLPTLGPPASAVDPWFATLRPQELSQMTAGGLCHIGAHSETHAVLTRCGPERLRTEAAHARKRLRNEKGYVDVFAYPHGRYNAEVLREVKEAGFRGAVTVEHRLCRRRDSPFEIPRIGVGANMDIDQFAGTMLAL